jgi:hypothetical protein
MVLGEVLNDKGNWSGYLPHRHPQPECYYFKFDRPEGFGASFVGDEVFKSVDNSFSAIPGGALHPQSVAPGFQMYTCWMIRHLDGDPWLQTTRNEDEKYIDNILQGFDSKFENIKTGFWKGSVFWLLFNIGNFLIIASQIRYSHKDNRILLPCIIWLIVTTGWFLLPSLRVWLKLKHEKMALENSKIASSCVDPEIALLTTDELAERMDIVCKTKSMFLILTIIFAVVAAITAPGLILLFSYGKQLTEPEAIIFYIVILVNYAMEIISFLCFNKYRKEYNRLQRR